MSKLRDIVFAGSRKQFALVLIFSLFWYSSAHSQINQGQPEDSTTNKQIRLQKRTEFKNSGNHNFIRTGYVFAQLDTDISFEIPDRNLVATVTLEDDFGLPGSKSFFTASYIKRITPASGIYANYYGIKRSENIQTQRDIIFKGDTIPSGLNSHAYFNTQVISTGYLFSIKQDPDAFLAAYFNIYFMWLDTGVESDIGAVNSKVGVLAPLPNLGLIAMFKINSWLFLNGNVGFFSLKTSEYSGSLYNFSLELMYRPVKWVAFDLSYQEFNIRVSFPFEEVNTTVNYNFNGPAIGLSFFF